jgi:hypothetical protein
MNTMYTLRLILLQSLGCLLLATGLAQAEGIHEHIPQQNRDGELAEGQSYFDHEHHSDYVRPALEQLTGSTLREGISEQEIIALIRDELAALPQPAMQPSLQGELSIPKWFLDGYAGFQPSMLARSRYLNGVQKGSLQAQGDIAALYGFWSCYDAEWFVLSRNPATRAWLSAVLLSYPAEWQRLNRESSAELHARLVRPLQTKDEPYREIDNWIKAFKASDGVFLKPKVRDVLVQEFVFQAGMESDERYYMEHAWDRVQVPAGLGLARADFMLMCALCLEFAPQLAADPACPGQLAWFRDFFIEESERLR